jgi:hypothetical protein
LIGGIKVKFSMFNLIQKRMRKYIVLGLMIVAILCLPFCQKTDSSSSSSVQSGSLETNLKAAVSSILTTDANVSSDEDLQSIYVENFDELTSSSDSSSSDTTSHGHHKHRHHSLYGPAIFDVPTVSSCATVTVSSSTYPKTITLDYGTGCTNSRGQFKQGKIVIEMSDSLVVAGAVKTITYVDFYVDSVKIDLTAVIKNLGTNSDGNWVLTSSYSQTTTTLDSDVITEANADTIVWTSGYETTDKSDDIYYRSGYGSTVVNDTLSYSRNITTPLLIDKSCDYIKSGVVVLTVDSDTIIIDYGDGTCDDTATVTTNGTTEEIDLDTYHFPSSGTFQSHSSVSKHHHH